MTYFKDQLLPSLFDRLLDEEPRKSNETQQDKVINVEQYRRAVLRDILCLLNTNNLQGNNTMVSLPENVQSSVLNYGIIPFSGINFSDIQWQEVEQKIRLAICHFEPRLDATTLQVNARVNEHDELLHNRLIIEIKGNLKINPYPQEFLLRTSMDIETGMFDLVGSDS